MKNSSSNYETALVDTNIFLKTIDIRHIADTITITPEILAELKDPQVKSFFASCPIPYAVREASKDSLAAVIDAATIVGDVHVLSKADISLIALARDIAIELGDGELLKTPELKDTVRMKRKVDRDRKQRIPPGKDFSPVIREMMLKEKEEERAKIEKETDGWVFAGRKKNKNKKNPNINNNKETVDSETKPTASQDEIKVENEEKPELAKENKEKEEGDKKETTSGQNTDKTECKSNKSSRKGNKKRRARGRNKDFFKINGMDGNWITEETLEKERDMGRKELVIIDDDDDDDKTKEEKNTSNNDNNNNNNNNNNNSKPLSRHKSILLTADTPMQNTAVALGLCVVMPKNSFEDVREVVKSRADFIVIKKCRANRICCKACSYVLNPEEVPNVCPACGTEHMFVRVWANINSEGQIYGITQAAIQNAKLIDTQSKKIDWYHRPGLAALSGADWFQQDFAGPTTIRRTARDYKLPKGQQRKTIGLDSSRVIVGERLMATQNDNGK